MPEKVGIMVENNTVGVNTCQLAWKQCISHKELFEGSIIHLAHENLHSKDERQHCTQDNPGSQAKWNLQCSSSDSLPP